MKLLWSLHLCALLSVTFFSTFHLPGLRSSFGVEGAEDSCLADRLTVYRVIMEAHWSREDFPKHYPDWRPPAHWSKIIGRSHNESYSLFRLHERASEGLRIFAETGASDVLDELSQGEGGIYDEFNAPPIPQGVGRAEAEFFVDGKHSRVSLVSRMTPSPDWFVGVSNYRLCENGRWIESATIEVDPLDAGTDSGLTFTAPNWKTEPRGVIKRLTPKDPSHPASSFYYKNRDILPPIASFRFLKVKEYELSKVFHHPEQDISISTNDVTSHQMPVKGTLPIPNLKSVYLASSMSLNKENKIGIVDNLTSTPIKKKKRRSKKSSFRNKRRRLKKFRQPRDCRVSEWSPWTPCSKTCGLGEMTRQRTIVVHARRGGRPCPPLKEARWCGSARSCSRNYFNWR